MPMLKAGEFNERSENVEAFADFSIRKNSIIKPKGPSRLRVQSCRKFLPALFKFVHGISSHAQAQHHRRKIVKNKLYAINLEEKLVRIMK